MDRLLIIDSNALMYRAWHAISPLTAPNGEAVNAVYGFTSMLFKAIEYIKPTHIATAFDTKVKTFRHLMYPKYKAGRTTQPNEFYNQFSLVKKILNCLRIPIFEHDGFEADDIIGTLSNFTIQTHPNMEVVIASGDFDLLQLINPRVKVLIYQQGVTKMALYDEDACYERYGLEPSKLIDYKALVGDKSDNIPGAKGIGEKTALELLKQFDNLKRIYDLELDEQTMDYDNPIKISTKKLLKQYKNDVFISQELVTIKKNLELNINLDNCKFGLFNEAQIICLFEQLNFASLIRRIPKPQNASTNK